MGILEKLRSASLGMESLKNGRGDYGILQDAVDEIERLSKATPDRLIKLACIIISQEEADGRGVCPDPARFEDYVRTAARVFDANRHSDGNQEGIGK